ncbi:conserved hypothetical protein [Xanthobacter versatilis]|uniref:HNH endonuclease n=1 Tax=Xanthobacter autotrophicus (strain ATCC BAA-1158 / Py2) TaxID=78245 RepID=A7IMI2_XANP2|nr:conserved hypothetical protein [Xanthobacter autotrophicus Py2]
MPGPSEKTIRRLFAMSGNMCTFPGCSSRIFEATGTVTGEVCHIRAQSSGGPRFDSTQTEDARHAFANLILLCRRHHKIIDAEPGLYSVDTLEEIKTIQEEHLGRPKQETDGFFAKVLLNAMSRIETRNNTGNVVIGSLGAIVAGTLNFKGSGKAPRFQTAAGTIGADQEASRYVQYLIRQYNQFASADTSRATKFNHAVISKNIESRFRSSWRDTAMERFAEVCVYLQERIRKTRVAKSNSVKGHRSFSTFEDYTRETKRAP